MTLKLPLNLTPKVRTYTNDLYLNAVLSSNCGDSDLLACLNIKNFKHEKYNIVSQNDNTDVIFDNNKVEIHGNKSNKHTRVFIYRKISSNDELVVKVDLQQYNSCWSSVNIFAANKVDLNNDDNQFNCRVGIFNNGIIRCNCCGKLYSFVNNKYSISKPYYLKIKLHDDYVKGYISLNGTEWDKLCECPIEACNNQKIGIDLDYYPNIYWQWLYSSYINIYFNLNWDIHINYLTAPMRNYNFSSINPIVYFKRENSHFVLDQNESYVKYIKSNIEHRQYVELYFDEFFVPHSINFHSRHFLHGILAYGFDDSVIYFLGVHNGKSIKFTLSYSDVEAGCRSSVKISDTNTFIVYEFLPDQYSFNVTALYKSIRDYLSKVPDNIEYYNIDDPNNIYGINVFDELSDGKGLDLFISDIRIPFLIDEHTRLMRERVQYLISSDILTNDECEEVSDMLNYLCDCTNKLLLITLKYSMTGSKNISIKVSRTLKDIQCQQKKCYSKLLCLLRKHVNKDRIEYFGKFN